ncbi:hypothetical protein F4604DRAFT_1600010 [Suillus subluteus]|nr:hypothetical protein F4604DRAFT_1600010 [Suillus subluteus]
MEHILTECPNNNSSLIWSLAKDIWPENFGAWPRINIGIILGCGSVNINPHRQNDEHENHRNQKPHKGASRLLKILIAESAYLIWTTRCDRTINGTTLTKQSIIKRWSLIINKRLQLDRLTARKINRTPSFLKLITSTWHDIITLHEPLPKNWAIALEVLVGIKPPRPSLSEATR